MSSLLGKYSVLICGLIFLALTSCRKKESFPVQIINHSGYDITELSFYGTVSGESISLNANDTSEVLIASYEKRIRLTPKLLRLVINNFDDQGNAFSVVRGSPTFPFSKQSLKSDINTIVITSEENLDTLTFNTTFN